MIARYATCGINLRRQYCSVHSRQRNFFNSDCVGTPKLFVRTLTYEPGAEGLGAPLESAKPFCQQLKTKKTIFVFNTGKKEFILSSETKCPKFVFTNNYCVR